MVVDIKGVGKDMFSIPIQAKCVVPAVQVSCMGNGYRYKLKTHNPVSAYFREEG